MGFGLAAGIGLIAGMTVVLQAKEYWEYDEAYDEEENIIYDFEEVSLMLPADWEGRYAMVQTEDAVYFSCQAIRDEYGKEQQQPDLGELFALKRSRDYDFMEQEAYREILGSSDEYVYYLAQMQGNPWFGSSEEAAAQWKDMDADIEWILENIAVTAPGDGIVDMDDWQEPEGGQDASEGEDSEYILEDSSVRYLDESDLEGMNAADLQMAINEIYARHGRKFVTKDIQKYFEGKSWYRGTVEASKFDPASLNQYENMNIAKMIRCMNALSASDQTFSGSTGATGSGSSGQTSAGAGVSGQAVSGTSMMATDAVKIRSTASTSGAVMGIVPQGYLVTATGSVQNGWIPVNYQGIKGYISAQYLTAANGSGSTSQTGNAGSAVQPDSGAGSTGEQMQTGGSDQTDTNDQAQSEGSSDSTGTGSVSAAVQLYTGSYQDSVVFQDMPYSEMPTCYEVVITSVSDTSFDFIVDELDRASNTPVNTLVIGTAEFTGDGSTAIYHGANGDVYFSFPNYHYAYPDVTDIEVSGLDVLAGKVMSNNNIPGHEFS